MTDFGAELRRLMAACGMSQNSVARQVPCDPGHLSKVVNGRKKPSARLANRLDDVLDAGGELAALILPAPAANGGQFQPVPVYDPEYGEDTMLGRRQFIAFFLAALGIAEPVRVLGQGEHIGGDHVDLVTSVLSELERADALEGGDRVCDGAAAFLDTVHDWVYSGSYSTATGNALTEAAGQLGAWVGWTAYDADRFAMARHYHQETLLLARVNDDRPLEACVLSSMCLQAQRRGRPREAVRLANTALRLSSGWATPHVTALLHLRAARGRAGEHDAAGFRRDLARAKNEFDKGTRDDDPLWIRFLTAAEVSGIEGMSMTALGRPDRAAECYRTAIELAGAEYPRNACYYQVRLAEALHETGDIAGSGEVAASVVPLVAGIRSARTRNRLAELRQKVTVGNAAAGEFADRYDEAFAV